MLRIAFCDDDLAVLNELNTLLDKYRTERRQDVVYAAFRSPLELLAQLEKGMQLDILFLDVLMPGENGIEAAKEIRQYDRNVKIIFLTSSAEFAVQSYTVGAYFYQLKPIWEDSFFRLMDSVIAECEKAQQNSLIVRSKTGLCRVSLDKLEYCEVSGRTLLFHLEDGRVLESSGSMDELCGQLLLYRNFLKPHRSYLVNMEYIQSISHRFLTMADQTEIPIPHGKCSEIKNAYLEYAFQRKQVFLS